MIRYYTLVAFRNIIRNKGFVLLNITGFALGLSVFLLIVFFVTDELGYDRYNTNHERIFRVDTELKYGGAVSSFAITAPPVADAMVHEFPEVKYAVRLSPAMNIQLKKGSETIQEDRVTYADQSLFEMFSFQLMDGSLQKALTDPGSIVINKSIALKYFGSIHVTGKTLTIGNDNSLHTITAVIDDMPSQSHFHTDLFLPLISQENSRRTSFNQFSFNTYLLLNDQGDAASLNDKLPAFFNKHLADNMDVDAFEKGGNYIRIVLTPLDNIHLYSNKQRELEANADVDYVYIFSAIATLILVLACINFTNLFTARSANRAKEVGVRKVLGSARGSIMLQFLLEAFIMTSISVIVAVVLAIACLPVFNSLSGKNFELTFTTACMLMQIVAMVTFVVALIAGIYPAFYLSAFQPVKVLKGDLSSGFRSSRIRNVLVVIQFSIATFLVIGTLVILHQLQFIQSKNVGFSREQVLIINNVGAMNDPLLLKQETKQISGVTSASLSGYLPTSAIRWPNSVSSPNHQGLLAEFWTVDVDYINTLQMELAAGRNFISDLASDSLSIILNESAAKILDLGADPTEKKIEAGGKAYTVVGVVKDFNFNSLRENVTPLVMILGNDWQANLIVRTAPGQLPNVLEQVTDRWKKLNPDRDLEYSFMDKDFEAMYVTEQRMKKLFTIFASLAIVIAGIGLFGLSAYAAEQRSRELSIRKILGATAGNLFRLLTFDFIKLIIIAVIVAVPLAWWMMERWLSDFAYRVDIPVTTLLFSAGLIVIVAMITISWQTLKAALDNPVDNLRQE
jgi:putative ABC transport system permease protein